MKESKPVSGGSQLWYYCIHAGSCQVNQTGRRNFQVQMLQDRQKRKITLKESIKHGGKKMMGTCEAMHV